MEMLGAYAEMFRKKQAAILKESNALKTGIRMYWYFILKRVAEDVSFVYISKSDFILNLKTISALYYSMLVKGVIDCKSHWKKEDLIY